MAHLEHYSFMSGVQWVLLASIIPLVADSIGWRICGPLPPFLAKLTRILGGLEAHMHICVAPAVSRALWFPLFFY